MIYKASRALLLAFLLYVATFIVGIISGVLLNTDMASINNTPDYFWYIGMVSSIVLTGLVASWYFTNKQIVPKATSGLLFGLTTVVLSLLLDLAILSAGKSQGAEVDLGAYYSDYRFWIVVALVVITALLTGYFKARELKK